MKGNMSSRIEGLEQNEKKKKTIITSVIAFLIIIFASGIIWGAKRVLQMQGTQEPITAPAASLTEIPKSVQGKIDYLEKIIINTRDSSKTSLSVSTELNIPDESIKTQPDSEGLISVAKYIKNDIISEISRNYPGKSFEFGEDFSGILLPVTFTPNDILSADCIQGGTNEDGLPVDEDFYFLSFKFKESSYPPDSDCALYSSLNLKGKEKILNDVKQRIKSMAQVEKCSIKCSDFRIEAKVSRLTDKLEYINYIRGYDFELTLRFKGDFAQLATRELVFSFYSTDKYTFSSAGISLNIHQLWLKKGDTQTVVAYKNPEENVSINWSSSNDDIASVDEDGYIRCKKISKEPVAITASFEFLGNRYTDSCEVYVINPVTSVKLSQKELRLKTGESTKLTAFVLPKKATIKGVLWFSDDKNVASVDENGNVFAKSAGVTTVYVLSSQGYYKSSCTVIVTE